MTDANNDEDQAASRGTSRIQNDVENESLDVGSGTASEVSEGQNESSTFPGVADDDPTMNTNNIDSTEREEEGAVVVAGNQTGPSPSAPQHDDPTAEERLKLLEDKFLVLETVGGVPGPNYLNSKKSSCG
jgi:hypothetical protein